MFCIMKIVTICRYFFLFGLSMLILGFISLMFLCSTASGSTVTLKGRSPNIILVLTDDQGYGDLSCHGNPILKTPHLDNLHAQSIRFTNFHVSPTCAPTRSAIMTGRHEFKNGVTHTIFERERLSLDSVTIAQTLQKAGYSTGIFGKWHLGDEDAYQPEKRGFDEVFIHGGGGIGQKFPGSCADVPVNQKNGYFNPVIKHNGIFEKTTGFCTDVFFRQALSWMNEKRKQDRPFFAYIATNAPHSPYVAPEKYKNRFLQQGLSEKLQGFYGMIENIDDNMGILMKKLSEWQLDENTLLIFMTDNGTAAGDNIYNAGMKGNKLTPDEGGVRVPAFFYWKGKLPGGIDIDKLTAHLDLFPTLAELGNAALPDHNQIEGRSLVPLLQDPKQPWDDRFLFTHIGRWENGADPEFSKFKGCSVRSERFLYVNNEALYDMKKDPGQTVNITEQYPDIIKTMRTAYDQWWNQARPRMVNEGAQYRGLAPFINQYEEQKVKQGIPQWNPPGI